MKNIRQLFIDFIKEYKCAFFIYFLTLLYIPISTTYIPKLYGDIISNLKNKKFKLVKTLFITLIIGWVIIQILNTASSYIMNYLMPKFKQYVRTFMINEIMNKYKVQFENLPLGDTITKIIKTPYILEDVFWMMKDVVINNVLTMLSIFGYLYYYNYKLGLIFMGFCIVLFGLSYLYNCKCKNNIKNIEVIYDKTHEEIEDTLSNLISIYTARTYTNEADRLNKIDNQLYENVQKMNKCKNLYRLMFSLLFIVIIIYLNYKAYNIYLNKEIKLDTFISVFIINYSLLSIFMDYFRELNEVMSVNVNINLILDFLENKLPKHLQLELEKANNAIPDEPTIGKIKNTANKNTNTKSSNTHGLNIAFKNVKFRYNEDEPYILTGLNLIIEPLETILIKGPIGSGKSTFSKLLLKYQINYEGLITINGMDHKKIDLEDIREKIIYIPQHPNLFNRTLRDNILYGVKKGITATDILNKLDDVGMTDLRIKFETILDKLVGKLGSKLSGGQRQIVWILRCLFNNSKMIILDEPTSSLDAESKQNIIQLIKELKVNRSIVIITHDNDFEKDKTLYNRLIKFDKGNIKETFKNLI